MTTNLMVQDIIKRRFSVFYQWVINNLRNYLFTLELFSGIIERI